MVFRTFSKLALAAALAAASPALAATPAEVQLGMQVLDPSGGTVGKVIGIKGANLILKTDAHEVQLPMTSFTANEGKLLFGMTAAELNAETEAAMTAAAAAISVGAKVYGSDGTLAGTIEALDETSVTIKLADERLVRIPRSGVAGRPVGAVVGVTTAKLADLASEPAATPAETEEPAKDSAAN